MRRFSFHSHFSLTASFIGSCALLLGCNTFNALAHTPNSSLGASASKGDYVRFKLAHLEDGRSGGSMIDYLVPYGWTGQGKAVWDDGNGTSIRDFISTKSPQGNCGAGSYLGPWRYMNGRYSQQPIGVELHHATDFDEFALKNLAQSYHLTDVQIVKKTDKDLPLNPIDQTLAQNIRSGMNGYFFKQQGLLVASASLKGQKMTVIELSIVSGGGSGSWNTFVAANYIVTNNMVIYPADASKRIQTEAWASTMSMIRITPHFGNYCAMIVKANNEASRREINDPSWHERSMSKFREQMGEKDANAHRELNYIRDENDYETPGGGTVTLPYFNSAWSDGHGGYIMSDDKTFNPNGIGGSWSHLKRKGV